MSRDSPKVMAPQPRWRFLDDNGKPLAGAKLFTYLPGTTTKTTTWTDSTGLTPNTNPIILDANGECDVWIPPLAPFSVPALPAGPQGPPGPPGRPGVPGATGNAAEFSNAVDLDSETIYTDFYGQYKEIVPAQGDGTIIVPVLVALNFHYATVPYAMNSANFGLNWGPPTIPIALPNGVLTASILESGVDQVRFMPDSNALNGELVNVFDAVNKPLTLTIDAAPDGAPLIAIGIAAPGTGYVVGDTGAIDGDNSDAEYEVTSVSTGAVTGISLTAGGSAYASDTAVATSTGGAQAGVGTGLTLDTTSSLLTAGSLRVTTWYRKLVLIPA